MHQGGAVARAFVGAHLPIQLVIVEQLIQSAQHRIDALGHARHPCKHIFSFIAIHQHLVFLLRTSLARFVPSF